MARIRRTYPETQAWCPTRPPDWRWQRALALVASGQFVSAKRDDAATCRAARFIRALKGYVSEWGVRNLTKKHPAIAMAVKLQQGDGLQQLELKARILARQTPVTIGRAMGLPASVVQTYGDLFFGIQDRLDAEVYIIYSVAGMPLNGQPSPQCLALVSAYLHGPAIIPAWLDYFAHADEHHDLRTPEGRSRASIALLIRTRALPYDAETNWSLVRRHWAIFLISNKTAPAVTVARAFAEKGVRNLAELPWRATAEPQFEVQAQQQKRHSRTSTYATSGVA